MINEQNTANDHAEQESGEEAVKDSNPDMTEEETDAEQSAMLDEEDPQVLKAALDDVTVKADQHWQQYLRTAAELENVRKRAVRDVENAHKYGLEKFAGEVLNIHDSLMMGLAAARDEASVESLLEGSEMTLKLFNQVLNRHGIKEINPLGEVFNPEWHEAMTMLEVPDAEPNTVVEVIQTGYEINGRLLRAARVIIAKP